ncbi:MAG TPA: MogA/MoaB family molybdenum cofactor biosynthesis protein [Myxococcota bacterium]|jgi:molybdenum cofactor biosynthesis protein B|nr:MogA/MoaB family molybdenum cofactor biosynthesis protein [Myxococcota bacterium]
MGTTDHRDAAAKATGDAGTPVGCAVLTISDTRTAATDTAGPAIQARLRAAGFAVTEVALCADDPAAIRAIVTSLCARPDVDAVIATGGTGVAPRDQTPEALEPLFERRLDGFGELFRLLSFQQIGAAAMLSRAVAGTVGAKAVFALPGSPAAVALALDRLILPELRHLVWLLRGAVAPAPSAPAPAHAHHRHHHHQAPHAHSHDHDHGHGHDHAHDHDHADDHDHDHAHAHDPDDSSDHDHPHPHDHGHAHDRAAPKPRPPKRGGGRSVH